MRDIVSFHPIGETWILFNTASAGGTNLGELGPGVNRFVSTAAQTSNRGNNHDVT